MSDLAFIRDTPAWREVSSIIEQRLEDVRSRLEAPGISRDEAQLLRGEISAMKAILALPETGKVAESTDPDYNA